MDETVIVIMLKDEKTGFFEKELGCYAVDEYDSLIYNTFAVEGKNGIQVHLKLTSDRDVEDWEYEAIFDYYDNETFSAYVTSIQEDTDYYNPTWEVIFPFTEDIAEMEKKIITILEMHKKELYSVYEAIRDKKDDYSEN